MNVGATCTGTVCTLILMARLPAPGTFQSGRKRKSDCDAPAMRSSVTPATTHATAPSTSNDTMPTMMI